MTTLVPVSSSWDVDDCGVRPLGVKPRNPVGISPRRAAMRKRIAERGTTETEHEAAARTTRRKRNP